VAGDNPLVFESGEFWSVGVTNATVSIPETSTAFFGVVSLLGSVFSRKRSLQ